MLASSAHAGNRPTEELADAFLASQNTRLMTLTRLINGRDPD